MAVILSILSIGLFTICNQKRNDLNSVNDDTERDNHNNRYYADVDFDEIVDDFDYNIGYQSQNPVNVGPITNITNHNTISNSIGGASNVDDNISLSSQNATSLSRQFRFDLAAASALGKVSTATVTADCGMEGFCINYGGRIHRLSGEGDCDGNKRPGSRSVSGSSSSESSSGVWNQPVIVDSPFTHEKPNYAKEVHVNIIDQDDDKVVSVEPKSHRVTVAPNSSNNLVHYPKYAVTSPQLPLTTATSLATSVAPSNESPGSSILNGGGSPTGIRSVVSVLTYCGGSGTPSVEESYAMKDLSGEAGNFDNDILKNSKVTMENERYKPENNVTNAHSVC